MYYTITVSRELRKIFFYLRNEHGRMIECVAALDTIGMDGVE